MNDDSLKNNNPLGNRGSYEQERTYSPDILFAIPRLDNRKKLNLDNSLPFTGWDRWNAYEFSFLDNSEKPVSMHLQIDVPSESKYIVESKSLKLYLNSLSFKPFENIESLEAILKQDLENVLEAKLRIKLSSLDNLSQQPFTSFKSLGWCVDYCELNNAINFDQVDCNALLLEKDLDKSASRTINIQETLTSHLFRSLCPVTSQPDWASIIVTYQGEAISHSGLLAYLLSFRRHQGFHEDCAERIFCDIQKTCQPEKLSVYAAYTRRGGIDINPFRTNFERHIPFGRLARQ
jgi:7-cyano-7-deazaguanine reductase